ncbi:MAG: DeoR/GlpR transcriptional regulator [bacterium]|nr:DeoR/GlpR transcriptional regulator [bacterium]
MNKSEEAAARRFGILEAIAELATKRPVVSFGDIKEIGPTGVGDSLLQADLKKLADLGLIEKAQRDRYTMPRSISDRIFSSSYRNRRQFNKTAKKRVAEACLSHKRAGGTYLLAGRFCFISPGTTTEPLFGAIRLASPDQLPQHVVTNSLRGVFDLLEYGSVGLTVLGGRPDRDSGAIRPQGEMGSADQQGDHRGPRVNPWLGPVQCDLAVLSVSAISKTGELFCSDDMEEFRRSFIELGVEVVILADMTKLRRIPVGSRIDVKPDWERTWLFVDKPAELTRDHEDYLRFFEQEMGDRFVQV